MNDGLHFSCCDGFHAPCARCARNRFEAERDAALDRAIANRPPSVPKNVIFLSKESAVKFLVINDQAVVQHAKAFNWPEGGPARQSASFDSIDEAKAFASYLAKKYREQGFHVFQAIGTAKTEEPPVKWTEAKE